MKRADVVVILNRFFLTKCELYLPDGISIFFSFIFSCIDNTPQSKTVSNCHLLSFFLYRVVHVGPR